MKINSNDIFSGTGSASTATRSDHNHDATYLKLTGGTMTGTVINALAGVNKKIYNSPFAYETSTATMTGTLKITLPKTWTSTMLHMTIKGYDYSATGAWTIQIGGYNYASTPSWVNTSADIRGGAPFNRIRFAHDGTRCCVLLGITTTTWNYPRFMIDQLAASFGSIDGWETGWSSSFLTTETGLTNIVEPTLNAGIAADLLDGMHAATANTVSTVVARDASGNFSAGTITAALTGNASTATKLATARTINGINFDGSAAINVSSLRGGNGTDALIVADTAGAVNYVSITSKATGGYPLIEAKGTDTNIGIAIKGKGTGPISIMSQTLANYINVTPAATTTTPTIAATGTDTAVSLNLTSKGSGQILANGYMIYHTGNLTDFNDTTGGLVPNPVSSSGRFLRDDGTWASAAAASTTIGKYTLQYNVTLDSLDFVYTA